jgi:hypothetical protein
VPRWKLNLELPELIIHNSSLAPSELSASVGLADTILNCKARPAPLCSGASSFAIVFPAIVSGATVIVVALTITITIPRLIVVVIAIDPRLRRSGVHRRR